MRRVGTGAAAVGVIGAGGSRVAPQYCPVGRAEAALPIVPVGAIGVTLAASYLVGSDEDVERGVDEYDTLDRLSIWANAYRNQASADATRTTLNTFVRDFADFSYNNLYAEAAVATAEAAKDQSQEDSIETGVDNARGKVTNTLKNIIDEAHHEHHNFVNLLRDASIVSGFDLDEMLRPEGHDGADNNWIGFDEFEDNNDSTTIVYELPDGSEYEKVEDDVTISLVRDMGGSDGTRSALSGGFGLTSSGTAVPWELDLEAYEVFGSTEIFLEDFPMDEYEDLDEETKEGITPPDTDLENPTVWNPQRWIETAERIGEVLDHIEAELETWLDGIYDDLSSGDLDTEEALTPFMLAEISSDQQTFPYAGSSLASLGLPASEQTVTLEFPETTEENDDGEEQPVSSTGNLFAHPMPSSGFQVGSTYDPDSLDTSIYYQFHTVDENGEQSSQMTQLEEPFTVLNAQELQEDEDGELVAVDVDSVNYSQRVPSESPVDYDELKAALDSVGELEQEIASQEREIVVDLEGDSGGGGGWWPDFGGDLGGFGGPIIGALAVLAAIVGIGQITS